MYAPPAELRRKRRAGSALSFLFLAGLLGCEEAALEGPEKVVPKVTTVEAVQEEITDYDEYTGRTEASESVEIHARVFGYLKSIDFEDGAFVEEGQTLFTIEPDEYEAIHNQALSKIAVWESKLEFAKAQLARRELLLPTRAITREEYEEFAASAREAEASLEAARADAKRSAIDLKYTVVKAPISGRVDRAFVSKGELLTGGTGSGTLLTKIVNEQPMYVYFDVDEQALLRYLRQRPDPATTTPGSLKASGVRCYVQLADEPDFPHEGVLDFVETEVDPSTGTARIRGVFPNTDRALVSGLFVRVRIPVSQPYQATLIPESALGTDQSIKFVYVVDDQGIAERRLVELGRQLGDRRIVASGLKPGDRVVVKGLQRVRPGEKVEAAAATPHSPEAPAAPPATPSATSS